MRADVFLVEHGFATSRAEAQDAIRNGLVTANGVVIGKSSQRLTGDEQIAYAKTHRYVSRGGLKLSAALDRFGLLPVGLICLDLGASTGGFTHVLLERGARRVYAVDVGHGQLHSSLARHPGVMLREGVNVRALSAADVPEPPQAITADLSFISLEQALPAALAMAAPGAWLVALVKPQFEVGKSGIGKGGIVRDAALRERARDEFLRWLKQAQGWDVIGSMESPIAGGDGNREFLVAAQNP